MARVYRIDSHTVTLLSQGWRFASTEPGAAQAPAALTALPLNWRPALVPGTVASAERALKAWSFDTKRNYDAQDWWYQTEFVCEPARAGERRHLRLDGLASVADVWVDDELVLFTDNMFVAHRVELTALAPGSHRLSLRFRSLEALLKAKKPRPRWRTKLVEAQNLRTFRTTLIGRVPAFTPPVVAVGPYRAVALERAPAFSVRDADVQSELVGSTGVVSVRVLLTPVAGAVVRGAQLSVGAAAHELSCDRAADGTIVISGRLEVAHPPKWWPHTHGAQPRLPASIAVALDTGELTIDLGAVAFRTIELRQDSGGFALLVNGAKVFCRGACWTTTDVVTLSGIESVYRAQLQLAREAGMNMLRLAGTNAYEADLFYELCDELGILIWQDFMFANMDYPNDDGFVNSVRREVDQFVSRTQTRACMAVFCGSSEVEQQVAMLGLPRDLWHIPLFREHIPAACHTRRPDVPYCSSSPTGGALPFHVNTGVAHYYGVGAYLRPLEDARRAEVRFASECLAFANIPEESTLETFIGGVCTPQNVRWKERAPRDSGGSWDFDDVRDHYVERLFKVDARELRTTDLERYLTLGRMATGEVMANVFAEWRRGESTCSGGIVFAYQDFWPGAGFGVIDALGRPKAAYYYLKRAFAQVALFATDEGSNGVALHAVNDTAADIDAELRVELYRHGEVPVLSLQRAWRLLPRQVVARAVDQELEHFVDSAYAYRFGPPVYDVMVARLHDRGSESAPVLAEAYFFPAGMDFARKLDIGLRGAARKIDDRQVELTVTATQFAQAVCIDAGPFVADQNWFHLAPGASRIVQLRTPHAESSWSCTLHAANTYAVSRVTLAAPADRTE